MTAGIRLVWPNRAASVRRSVMLWVLALGTFLTVAMAVGWWITEPRPAIAEADAASLDPSGDPARGKGVFDAGDCASCHASPGQPDRHRLGAASLWHRLSVRSSRPTSRRTRPTESGIGAPSTWRTP